jgi:hypothetical protein
MRKADDTNLWTRRVGVFIPSLPEGHLFLLYS